MESKIDKWEVRGQNYEPLSAMHSNANISRKMKQISAGVGHFQWAEYTYFKAVIRKDDTPINVEG